ncbi:DUF4349 domain-containing protein [Glaciihabitans arcticus]|uniref:DUF4349 domain-containing protein n=1 Tax=Glaciihabitans arcticus TaxID=2668039 RepID=A0A4Q9GVD0_9MICO|nr:DUF4349 domain-containing protein [Glaciihabitans arcticus]TBN57528.1 DUF4349 domain-containing protein [Glaciihabitans arcticus]
MRRMTSVPAIVVLAILALSGCSAGMSSAPERASDQAAPQEAGGLADGFVAADREIITNGSVSLTVVSPAKAATEAARIAEAAGGRVDARSEEAAVDGDKGRATLTLRLPSKTLTPTLEKIKKLGKVQTVDIATTDVTDQTRDLDSRIDALAASIARLQSFMKSAKTVNDLITLETSITERQGNLEAMQGEQRSLEDQVSLSTIDLFLGSEADAPIETPSTFFSGLQTGWDSFVAFVSAVLVTLGVLLPWLVFLGLIGLAVLVILRRRARRPSVSPATPVAPAPAE